MKTKITLPTDNAVFVVFDLHIEDFGTTRIYKFTPEQFKSYKLGQDIMDKLDVDCLHKDIATDFYNSCGTPYSIDDLIAHSNIGLTSLMHEVVSI